MFKMMRLEQFTALDSFYQAEPVRETQNPFTGMVYCPQRWSEIAIMRCGEYQRAGCRCAVAARPEQIREAWTSMRCIDGEPKTRPGA